jgi:hypothetical protein
LAAFASSYTIIESVYVTSKWGNPSRNHQSEAVPLDTLQLNPFNQTKKIVQLKSFELNGLSLFPHLCAPFIYCPSNLQYSEWSKPIKLGPGRKISLHDFGLWKMNKESAADTVHNISLTIFLIDLAQTDVCYLSKRATGFSIRLPKRKTSWRRQPRRHERRPYEAWMNLRNHETLEQIPQYKESSANDKGSE